MVDIINPLVSEKVMCWHREVLPNNDEGLPYFANFWVHCENVKQKPVNFWSPTTNLEDVMKDEETDMIVLTQNKELTPIYMIPKTSIEYFELV